jgi:hypothetical protein
MANSVANSKDRTALDRKELGDGESNRSCGVLWDTLTAWWITNGFQDGSPLWMPI